MKFTILGWTFVITRDKQATLHEVIHTDVMDGYQRVTEVDPIIAEKAWKVIKKVFSISKAEYVVPSIIPHIKYFREEYMAIRGIAPGLKISKEYIDNKFLGNYIDGRITSYTLRKEYV